MGFLAFLIREDGKQRGEDKFRPDGYDPPGLQSKNGVQKVFSV